MITRYDKGYTLLFAVIVSSIVLSVAAFILSVSRKQFILSSVARDSTEAIYAADSGIQCAVKADQKSGLSTSLMSLDCNSSTRPISWTLLSAIPTELDPINYDPNEPLYKGTPLDIAMGGSREGCIKMTLYIGTDMNGGHVTVIESRGYNIGDASNCPVNHPRTTERAIRLVYYE